MPDGNPARTTDAISAVAVVIPAHNEEALLPRCLTSVDRAVDRLRRSHPAIRVEVIVALDACTDGTAAIAEEFGARTVALERRCVGVARATGVANAAGLLRVGVDHAHTGTWLACTDADSAVPVTWLTEQVALAEQGADLVIGRVAPDPHDLAAEAHREWSRLHPRAHATRHVHGANLGIRWSSYEAAGGFPPIAEHEDARLVETASAQGARVAAGPEILTSGRQVGRVSGGFSGYLRLLVARLAG